MQFKQTTIAPAGRNKYGNYMSSGNVTKSVVMTTYAGNETTTSIGNTGGGEEAIRDFYVMLSQTSGAFSTLDLAQHITVSAQVIAYRGYEKGYTMILDMDSVAATVQDQAVTNLQVPPNNGILTVPSGMSVSFRNNGTTGTTIDFTVDENLTGTTEGTMMIPVCVYKRGDNIPLPDDIQNWWEHQYMIDTGDTIVKLDDCEVVWLEWSWKVGASGEPGPPGASGESAWYLTLSNDNASINCDADGNILSGATRPTCKVKLYHGNTQITANSAVTYSVNYGGASGVTRSTSNGVMTLNFGTGFTFTGTSVAITVSAATSTDNIVRDVKVMNITKVYPGEDGEPAVSYTINTSFGEILYDPNTHEWSPHQIMASATKQVGQNPSEEATDTYIKYSFEYRNSPGSFTTESGSTTHQAVTLIPVTSGDCESYCRLRVTLYKPGTLFPVQLDREDIDILWNGVNGEPGQGRQGPAIRGPYDWDEHSGSTRCWCSGTGSTGCDECSKWIDVIVKDGTYYYCNTTYYGSLSPWSSVSSNWTSGDTFDFIATNLLLANGAKIKFLTGNEIYLSYSNGGQDVITGGLAGGTGTTIWSGGDNPDTAKFRVDYQGNIYAESGVFAGYIQMPYADASALTHTGGTQYNAQVTYFLDTKAYVIVGPSGVGTPSRVVLPTPNASLNGFVYYLIVKPARLNTQSNTEGVSVEAIVSGNSAYILDYVYQPYDSREYSRCQMYSGKYQFVHEIGGSYRWLLTEATGGANLYGTTHPTGNLQNHQDWVEFRPVFGFQAENGTTSGKPQIKNISTDTGWTADDNTLYVQP